jgi:hypothetical protein
MQGVLTATDLLVYYYADGNAVEVCGQSFRYCPPKQPVPLTVQNYEALDAALSTINRVQSTMIDETVRAMGS